MATTYLESGDEICRVIKTLLDNKQYESVLGSMAQNACEMYLKEIIERKQSSRDYYYLQAMKEHKLDLLLNYLQNALHIVFDKEVQVAILSINSYYITTRYPGPFAKQLNEEEIRYAYEVTQICRKAISNILDIPYLISYNVTKFALKEHMSDTAFVQKWCECITDTIMSTYKNVEDTKQNRAYIAYCLANNLKVE